MKFILHFIFVISSMAIAYSAESKTLDEYKLFALMDGVILPSFQDGAKSMATNSSTGFSVIIIEDITLQGELSEKYKAYANRVKFRPKNAIEWKNAANNQGEGYFDKGTGKRICVHAFKIISDDQKTCVLEWSCGYASLGGTTKVVTMSFSQGKWMVVSVKLKSIA